MKKQIFLWLLIIISMQIASGQITSPVKKSTFLLGGSVFMNYENIIYRDPGWTFYDKSFTIGTDAYCGYFISNHISTGLLTDFSIRSSKVSSTLNDSELTEISNAYSFGPFLRYYTNPGIFFEGAFELGFWHFGSDGNQNKRSSYSLNAGVGYSLFINSSIALEPQIKYKYDKSYWSSEDQPVGSTSGIYFLLGLQFYLPTNGQ